VLYVHSIIVLKILNQNIFLSQHLFSDDVGGAITCHSHEISQYQTTTIQSIPHRQNQAPPTFVIVLEAFHSDIRHNREENTSVTSV